MFLMLLTFAQMMLHCEGSLENNPFKIRYMFLAEMNVRKMVNQIKSELQAKGEKLPDDLLRLQK